MTPQLRSVLLDPEAAFSGGDEPGLLGPLLVVLGYATVGLATVAPVLVAVADVLPVSLPVSVAVGTEEVAAPGIPVAIVALGIPLLLLAWTLVALVAFALARVLGGTGDLRETAAFVGWGFLPKLVSAVAIGALLVVVAVIDPDATLAEVLVGSHSDVEVGTLSISGPGGDLAPVVVAVDFLAGLWTAYVWYGGLRGAQALSRRRAVGLAVVLFLLFNGI